jgi:hypothetical protein
VTDRPILFSAPMVRAILAGTKTQTRRAVKLPKPLHPHFGGRAPLMLAHDDEGIELYLHSRVLPRAIRSPYGTKGDRLWVREAWRIAGDSDGDTLDMFDRDDVQYRADDDQGYIDRYRPSIHMPRRFSRITLDVTGVRVERLQSISADDAKAEGISEFIGGWICKEATDDKPLQAGSTPQEGYLHLWESINGPGSWGANPWVWVVEFKRCP